MMLADVSPIPDLTAGPAAPPVAIERPARRPTGSGVVKLGGLVLARHVGESIVIGDRVEVFVGGIRSGTARLKVVAPRSVSVHRREVFDAIRDGALAAEPVSATATPAAGEGPTAGPSKPGGGLVLARLAGQSIMIGGDVELTVVEVRPSTVKLRIAAPKSVAVHRREVFDAMRAGGA